MDEITEFESAVFFGIYHDAPLKELYINEAERYRFEDISTKKKKKIKWTKVKINEKYKPMMKI